ncbi:MAG TPA: hypothetical protein VGL62_01165 [Vicinamibacterales bacterium]|jgi:hypothetical protein
MKTVELRLPMFGFVVATRAAIGAGIGLLLSSRIPQDRRRAVGLTLIGLGAASTVPALAAVLKGMKRDEPALPGD